jgi:polyisoprenoid-binding protein YceI
MIRIAPPAALALAMAMAAPPAHAEPEIYKLDPSHSQIVFSYDHLGYSTTWGMFSGFEGTILFDADDPSRSSVSVAFPLSSMFTGWEARDAEFLGPDFLDAAANQVVTFVSTDVAVTGEDTGRITGDLTLGGVTREVVLDARLNQRAEHPIEDVPWLGFDATTTLRRSDFDAGAFAPFVSDEVSVMISIEAGLADGDGA